MSFSNEVDVWQLAEESEELSSLSDNASTLFIVGDSGCGKSTLIQSFLKPNSSKSPKPTFALDYNFARRKNVANDGKSKSLCHVWELGGDIHESKLLDVPLNPDKLLDTAILVVLDLSKPQNCTASLNKWLSILRSRIDMIMKGSVANSEQFETIRDKLSAPFTEHEDKSRISLFPLPVYVICNKLDVLRAQPVSDRRSLLQALRFITHSHGGTILATSSTESAHRDQFRSLMNSIAFQVNSKSMCEVSEGKSLYVTAGKDTFMNILLAINTGKDNNEHGTSVFASNEREAEDYLTSTGVHKGAFGRIDSVLIRTFGEAESAAAIWGENDKDGDADEENKDDVSSSYPEADIDEARAHRDLVLQQYLVEAARRERLNANILDDGATTKKSRESSSRNAESKDSYEGKSEMDDYDSRSRRK
jgi:dynein light intermediate chain 2, cytosolic